MGKRVNKTKSRRMIKKPVEMYHQDCILKATVMQNKRDKVRVIEKNRKSRAMKKHELEERTKEDMTGSQML